MEAWKEELYHHGILGMKWGKKNGPPYPLGASDHSAAEKKAGWRKSLSGSGSGSSAKERRKQRDRAIQDRYDREIERIESKSKGKYLSEKEMARQNAAEKKASNDWDKSKQQYKKERKEEKANRPGLSDKQKKAIKIGVAVVGTALAAYGAYKIGNAKLISMRNNRMADIIDSTVRDLSNMRLTDLKEVGYVSDARFNSGEFSFFMDSTRLDKLSKMYRNSKTPMNMREYRKVLSNLSRVKWGNYYQ